MEIERFEGKLPDSLRAKYELFMGHDRREAQIAKLYEIKSIIFVIFEKAEIAGTIRMITKKNSFDKLPFEFGVMELNDLGYSLTSENLPAIEAAYLKVIESLPLRHRSYILKLLCDLVFNEWIAWKIKIGYLSCDIDTNLERLYERFYGLKSIGFVSYGSKKYTLMARYHPSLTKESIYA